MGSLPRRVYCSLETFPHALGPITYYSTACRFPKWPHLAWAHKLRELPEFHDDFVYVHYTTLLYTTLEKEKSGRAQASSLPGGSDPLKAGRAGQRGYQPGKEPHAVDLRQSALGLSESAEDQGLLLVVTRPCVVIPPQNGTPHSRYSIQNLAGWVPNTAPFLPMGKRTTTHRQSRWENQATQSRCCHQHE